MLDQNNRYDDNYKQCDFAFIARRGYVEYKPAFYQPVENIYPRLTNRLRSEPFFTYIYTYYCTQI